MQLATMQRPEQKDHEASVFPANVLKGPEELAKIVSSFASSDGWIDKVRLNSQQRWYERLYKGLDYDIWAISWMPEQSTGFHDHGESSGAFIVVTGVLEEHRPDEQPLLLHPGDTRAFGSDYAHDVRNASIAPAVSIHAYSPPLSEMNKFELDGSLLIPRERASEFAETLDEKGRARRQDVVEQTRPSGIDHLLAVARGRLRRLSPLEAYQAATFNGAILVDIRPENQRGIEGSIPGALVVERNVLEWRFDPASASRLAIATGHDICVIVFCSEGYTSSLAAASLMDLGLWRTTDLTGGFQAWRAAGLPIVAPAAAS
jgi:rhodanese-related sulfurtransferase/mannose-6-phosphate isomerase-like protein (cupin superfamily)